VDLNSIGSLCKTAWNLGACVAVVNVSQMKNIVWLIDWQAVASVQLSTTYRYARGTVIARYKSPSLRGRLWSNGRRIAAAAAAAAVAAAAAAEQWTLGSNVRGD